MSEQLTPLNDISNVNSLDAQLQHAWKHLNSGDTEAASSSFRDAVKLAETDYGSESLEAARIYADVSTGLYLSGEQNYEEAANLLARALKIRTAIEGERSIDCGRLYRQLAAMQSSKSNFDEAVASYRKAVDIFEALESFGGDIDADEKRSLYKDLKTNLIRADEMHEESLEEDEQPAIKRLHHCVDSD